MRQTIRDWGLWVLGLAAVLISGCMPSASGNVYNSPQAQKAHQVAEGMVISVKPVTIQDEAEPLAGALAGGAAGGVLGSTIGSGAGKDVATVVGALVGAGGGAAIQKMMGTKSGLEIMVKLDTGESIVVVQEADLPFAAGDRVRVLTGPDGTTRVST